MDSALVSKYLAISSLGILVACTGSELPAEAPPVEIETSEHGLTHHVSTPQDSRGVSAFAGGVATARNSNYRVRFVVGPEMPIGVAEDANYKFLLGPMSPPGTITANVTPFPQPERAQYTFTHNTEANWSLKLYRKTGDVCTHGMYERTETNETSLTGFWIGLAPGASYCWRATATTYSGMAVRTGEFSLEELPVFVSGPTGGDGVAPHQLTTEVRAEISVPLNPGVGEATTRGGMVAYQDGDCATRINGLTSQSTTRGTSVINFPGELPVDDQWTWESWLQLDSAGQTKTIFGTRGGKTKIHLVNNVPTLDLALTGVANALESTDNLASNPWAHTAMGSINRPFTITPNYSGALAPDGSFTATRFERDQGSGVPNQQSWGQRVNMVAGNVYTLKIWLRSTTGESQGTSVHIYAGSGVNNPQTFTVDGTWREYTASVTPTVDGNPMVEIVTHDPSWPGVGPTIDILAWNPRVSAGPESTITLSSSQGLVANEWTHLAATYDGQTARLLVNGVVRAAQAKEGRLADGPLGSAIGNQWRVNGATPQTSSFTGFTGKIASLAMYDRGLSPAEIAARHQRGAAAELEGEVAWWPLDQATGASAPDVSGSALNGQLVNMANDDWVDDGGNRVLDFDGQDDHVILGASGSLVDMGGKSRFSLSLRFKARDVSREQAFYSTDNHRFLINGGRVRGKFVDSSGVTIYPRGSITIEPNRWYHLHLIFDGGEVRWYVNGVLDYSTAFAGPLQATPSSFSPILGARNFNSGTGVALLAFNGLLDDVRIIGAIGAWRIDESNAYGGVNSSIKKVNSVYDSTGFRYSGVLGRSHQNEVTDGSRFTDLQSTADAGPWNLFRGTETMAAGSGWSSLALTTGATDFTVSNNYQTVAAPDGSNTAIRLQRTRASSTDQASFFQRVYPRVGSLFDPINGTQQIISFWMRSTSNNLQSIPYRYSQYDNTSNAPRIRNGNVAVTADWQEFTIPIQRVTRQSSVGFEFVRHVSSLPATVDVLVWGLQMKEGATLTTPQRTRTGLDTYEVSTRLENLPGGPNYCFQMTANTPLGTISSYPLGTFTLPGDSEAPVITVDPVTIQAECDRPNAALLVVSEPSVTDNIDTNFFVRPFLNSQTGPPVSFPYNFALGSSVLHWRAEDSTGNVGWSNPNQTIRVLDTTDPVVTGGTPVIAEATSPNGTPFAPSPANATDVCDSSLTVTFTPTGPFPLGDTAVTFSVTDDSANEGTATRIVRIIDTTPPVFDPPLQNTSISRDSSNCFQPVLPTPSVRDNGYNPSQLTVTNERVSGPGLPNCWDVGTHQIEWTVSDPSNNTRTVTQTIEVVAGALNIDNPHLEVTGVTNPTTGRFYNQEVHYVFGISEGTAPYQVSVIPAPTRMVVNAAGTEFRAVYSDEGAYPNILVVARDDGGNGVNFGSFELTGFGIDLTPPVISDHLFDQRGVVPSVTSSFPPFYRGETKSLENIWALDGAWDLANLGNKALFTGNSVVTLAPTTSPIISTTANAASIETWVRFETLTNGTIVQLPRSGADAASQSAMELRMTSNGRVEFEVDGAVRTFTSNGVLQPRKWQHIAAVYGFDGGSLKVFVNGEPAAFRASTPSGSGVTLGGRPYAMVVGGRIDEADQLTPSFNGEMAELHVTEASLTEADVKSHYRGGLGRPTVATTNSSVLYSFGGTTQTVVDSSANTNDGVLGTTNTAESSDPTRSVIEYPAEAASSGMEQILVTVDRVDGTTQQTSTAINVTETLSGTPLRVGTRAIGGVGCNTTLNGACNNGDSMLRASVLRIWSGGAFYGSYRITIVATDSAGNSATKETYVRTSNYQRALEQTIANVTALSNDPNYAGIGELEDALLAFRVALSYWNMSSQYKDGSYLRADQGVQYLVEANNSGVDIGNISTELARALYADVNWYVDGRASGAHADDQGMIDSATALMETARFEGFRGRAGYQIAASRLGFDSVALLYPDYLNMRTSLRSIRARWQSGLSLYSQGLSTADILRIDQARTIQIRSLITASRDTLENVMYPQITAALANPYTTERRTLEEIRDVLDKTSSTDIDEAGDLIAITNTALTDACLDRLAILDLDDEIFTRCYLRLNDLARFLDSVSEPLVHTYLWRAGLALVLFNMLELSLNVSPTGLPWVTANVSFPDLRLVLPDQQAATVNGATALSLVDLPDNLLGTAYARYEEAKGHLSSGAVNSAWAIFVDERCLLLRTYNRYYSSQRSLPTAADPKEQPIDPATVGCGN